MGLSHANTQVMMKWLRIRRMLTISFSFVAVSVLIVIHWNVGIRPVRSEEVSVSAAITGIVSDGTIPVADAMVRIQGDTAAVWTDEAGRFILPVGGYVYDKVPVTVGKEGWFNTGAYVQKGASGVQFSLERLPTRDDRGYTFIDPEPGATGGMMDHMMERMRGMGGMMRMGMMGGGRMGGMGDMSRCGNCHEKFYEQWKGSKMAGAATNSWVLSLYNGTDVYGKRNAAPGYRLDYPDRRGGPCADCHAPSAAVRNPGRTDLNRVWREGGVDAKGVHCDFCHKIRNVVPDNSAGVDGGIELLRREMRGGMMMMRPVLAFGPYTDVVTMPMAATYSSLSMKSEYCASCHQYGQRLSEGKRWDYLRVYPGTEREALYEEGRIVPDQWTYQEWKEWQDPLAAGDPDKGKQCQDCHMNWTKELLPYERHIVDGGARRSMGVERESATIHPHHFEGATEHRLKTAAYLSLEGEMVDGKVEITVDIMNANAGHRLPTGESFRNMILLVEVQDANGNVLRLLEGSRVPEWGGVGLPEEGNYAGRPGKGFAKVMADAEGNLTVPYWRAVRIASDNRIPPKASDTSTYTFEVPDDVEEVTVEAKLIYRRAFKPLADAKQWTLKDVLMQEESTTIWASF